MQKISEIFIENIKHLPMWVKQVITKEIFEDLSQKLEEFSELAEIDSLFQYLNPKLTFSGKKELEERKLNLTESYYTFLKDVQENNTIFEITIKNYWTLVDCAKIFCRLNELELITVPSQETNKNIAIAMFIAGKLKTGEFLKRIGKISIIQLEQAIRYQKELNEEGRHIKMASILIKLGFITDKGLDSLLLLKEEAKRRLPEIIALNISKNRNLEDEEDQITRMQKELARLENENIIMKKRLRKLLKI